MDPERFIVNQSHQPERLPTDPLFSLPPAPPPRYGAKKKTNRSKWWAGLIVGLIVLLALAWWGYMYLKTRQVRHNMPAVQSKTAVKPRPAVQTPSIPSASHTALAYGATFSYPASWTVVDSGSAPLTLTSPAINLVAANGQTVLGQAVMTMSKQGSLPTAFTATSVAVLTSQKVKYSNPTGSQAAATYISFVQYPSTTIKGGLDGIFLTGNYGYQKDQTIPSADIAKINPLIDYTFFSCASVICPAATRQPLTISSTNWSEGSISAPILLTIKSFSFD